MEKQGGFSQTGEVSGPLIQWLEADATLARRRRRTGCTNVCKRLAIKALIEQCAALHPANGKPMLRGRATQACVPMVLTGHRPARSMGVMNRWNEAAFCTLRKWRISVWCIAVQCNQLAQWATAVFMESAHPLILAGGTGTVKRTSLPRWASPPFIPGNGCVFSTP